MYLSVAAMVSVPATTILSTFSTAALNNEKARSPIARISLGCSAGKWGGWNPQVVHHIKFGFLVWSRSHTALCDGLTPQFTEQVMVARVWLYCIGLCVDTGAVACTQLMSLPSGTCFVVTCIRSHQCGLWTSNPGPDR